MYHAIVDQRALVPVDGTLGWVRPLEAPHVDDSLL